MKVFLDRCSSYKKVEPVIKEGIDSLGGIKNFVKEGETLLVKPNLLRGDSPEKAINTHPDFIIAVVKILEEAGVNVIVVDSPGGPMKKTILKRMYRKAGWDRIEEETDAELNYDTSMYPIDFPPGNVIKSIDALGIIQDVDGVINLPKLKTHMFTVYTGAVKNMFGCVHGLTKSGYHGQYKGLDKFSKMLVDVNDAVNPRISIMDGIYGMEGQGPGSGGDLIKTNMVLASSDSTSLDAAACRSVGIPIKKVKTIKDLEDITYTKLTPGDFDTQINYPKGGSNPWYMPNFLTGFISNFFLKRPTLDKQKCIKCAKCREICPNDAITMKDYGPKISWWKCIRCYCCAEVCPVDALRKE